MLCVRIWTSKGMQKTAKQRRQAASPFFAQIIVFLFLPPANCPLQQRLEMPTKFCR